MRKLRILVITNRMPEPTHNAGDRRLFVLLEILAQNHIVDICAPHDDTLPDAEECKVHRKRLSDIGVRQILFGWNQLAGALAKTLYDVGFFEFYHMAEEFADVFRGRQPGAKLIVDSVDLHFLREFAGAKINVIDKSRAENTQLRELNVYRYADAVITVTDVEKKVLISEGITSIFIIPIIVPTQIRPVAIRQKEVLFVGGFIHLPNLDGIMWFVKEIWPLIHKAIPDAHLTIAGSKTPPQVYELAKVSGVNVVGYVPDTSLLLDRAAVSVAPLRYGAGMKGKVVEAMATGLPVVTTSFGTQGLNAIAGEHLMVADEPADFAQAVVELLQNPQRSREVGISGQNHIAKLCSPEGVKPALSQMLEQVVPAPHSLKDWWQWRAFHLQLYLRRLVRPFASLNGDS